MEQVIVGGMYNALHISATEYSCISGGYNWDSDAADVAMAVSSAGKIKGLRVKLSGSPGAGKSFVFTLYRYTSGSWGDTGLTCTISDAETSGSDIINEVTVSPGDLLCLKCAPTNSPATRFASWSTMFSGDIANESLILSQLIALSGATQYGRIGRFASGATENNERSVCPTNGIIKNLYVQMEFDPGTAPDAYRFTLRIGNAGNGYVLTDTALTCTITADDKTANDTANDITVAAGDILTIRCEPLNTPAISTIFAAIGMTFVADIDGESLLFGGTDDTLSSADTEYNYLVPSFGSTGEDWISTESQRYQLAQECTLKKLHILLQDSPLAGNKYTFTLRKGQADGNIVVEIADTATTGDSGALEDAVADGEYVDLKVVPFSSPSPRDAYWGLVVVVVEASAVGVKSGNIAAKLMAAGVI